MEYQPTKDEIPFYGEHESGWYFCDKKSADRLAELDFIEFRRPYFLFAVKFFTEDESVRESIFNPIKLDPNELSARYILLNRKSGNVADMKDLLTSRIGNTNTVTLGDRRRPDTVNIRRKRPVSFYLIRVLDIVSLNFIFKAIRKRKVKK